MATDPLIGGGDAAGLAGELSAEPLPQERGEIPPGLGPYRLALRRLRKNRVAIVFGFLFLVIVVLCLLAPVYAKDVAHTTFAANHVTEKIEIGGKTREVVSPVGIPIGPTWHSHFFLGADKEGRDIAVRLLYGGRNSLEIGTLAMLITIFLGVLFGTLAGYFGGVLDAILSRIFDLIWAYPPIILGIALGAVLNIDGINVGPIELRAGSLVIPIGIVGFVYGPYVAKPIRGLVLGLRQREFVDAARQQGLSHARIMFGEILPNLASMIIVFVPLMLANAILLEAALSYLGAGIQPPNPSWGTMISEGVHEIPGAIHLTLVPGIMLLAAVLGVNVFGDGVRDALDPRAKIRIGRR